jgi:hypothetical protein
VTKGDSDGTPCSQYNKKMCGKYDVYKGFNAGDMCCICGGGLSYSSSNEFIFFDFLYIFVSNCFGIIQHAM